MHAMPGSAFMPTTTRLRRTTARRALLLALVTALALAPLLVNIWPAFGRGAMLFVGETALPVPPQVDHAEHAGHEGNAAPASESHHQRHCALCVLALLGWAPPLDLGMSGGETVATHRIASILLTAPQLQLAWPGAHARAPPLS
jgi:hypothetical protein